MVGAETAGMKKNVEAPVSMAGAMPLTMMGREETKQVCSIRGKDDVRRFLANLGFVDDAEVRVVSEVGGNLIVAVKGTRVAVSRAMASRIMVR